MQGMGMKKLLESHAIRQKLLSTVYPPRKHCLSLLKDMPMFYCKVIQNNHSLHLARRQHRTGSIVVGHTYHWGRGQHSARRQHSERVETTANFRHKWVWAVRCWQNRLFSQLSSVNFSGPKNKTFLTRGGHLFTEPKYCLSPSRRIKATYALTMHMGSAIQRVQPGNVWVWYIAMHTYKVFASIQAYMAATHEAKPEDEATFTLTPLQIHNSCDTSFQNM